MTTQFDALRLADWLLDWLGHNVEPADLESACVDAATELRRLQAELAATERQVEILSDDLSRCSRLNAELLEFIQEVRRTGDTRLAYMAIVAIAKATGEQT